MAQDERKCPWPNATVTSGPNIAVIRHLAANPNGDERLSRCFLLIRQSYTFRVRVHVIPGSGRQQSFTKKGEGTFLGTPKSSPKVSLRLRPTRRVSQISRLM
ncbi:hypothetical protein CRM22_011291 [Opisthorchis felineus]|uniref:Uncharacterized protein n=1 Tax=Opisthorchis felineus TaxID=147828 RepID=A0A4S2JPW5_OPIFE|nr:hypothetical protein CRM22_011291 [Opisthorchis felineus]